MEPNQVLWILSRGALLVVTFAVVAVITLVVVVGIATVMKQNREAEAARRAAKAEREREDEARLAPKRRALGVLKAKAEEERRLFDDDYAQAFVHQHYDQIMNEWPREFDQYRVWKADQPDFDRLVRDLNADDMVRLWNRKAKLREDAAGLDLAARESWKARRFEEFTEANRRGVTLEELPSVRIAEARWVAQRKGEFDRFIHELLTSDGVLLTLAEQMQGLAEFRGYTSWESFEEAESQPRADLGGVSYVEVAAATAALMTRLQPALLRYAVARALGPPPSASGDGVVIRDLKEIQVKAIHSDSELQRLWVSAERAAFDVVLRNIERVVEFYEGQPNPSMVIVSLPYRAWAKPYIDRLGEPRTEAQVAALFANVGS